MRHRLNSIWVRQTEHSFLIELSAIFRDSGAILILLIAVWVYPLVYSIAYQNNVIRNMPMSVVDNDNSMFSRQLIRMIGATQEIEIKKGTVDFKEAKKLFWDGDSKGIILIPAGFEMNILNGQQSHVGLFCDAGYFLIYKESLLGTIRSTATLSAAIEIKRLIVKGAMPDDAKKLRDPISLKTYTLYNPAGSYGSYVMPGLIIVILQQTLLVGIGMIGGGRRERQKLLVSSKKHESAAIFSNLIGRSLAYFFLYSFNLIFTQIILAHWFSFPDKGQITDLWILMVPFLFSVIFMGLTVSLLLTKRGAFNNDAGFFVSGCFVYKRYVVAGYFPSSFFISIGPYFPFNFHDPCKFTV